MPASLKKNFFYSALLTLANYVFPLITYPYVSRVLGVTGIGICNFVDGIVNYFIVFSTMGISVLGVREIAAVRDNRQERSRAFSDLLTLTGITTMAAAAVLLGAMFLVPKLFPYRKLLFVGVAKLIAHSLSLEWFFRGIEEFKFITNRSIAIKTLFVAAVFIFVRSADDYGIYFLLLSLSVIINTLVNVIYSRRFTGFSFKGLNLKRFAGPFFLLGLNFVLTSFYSFMNVIYLGFTWDNDQVGFYTTATKILTIIIALISAFTTVMLPRMSAVLTDGRKDEFYGYVKNAVNVLFLVGLPAIFLLFAEAHDVIWVISGNGYNGAIRPMRIVSPMLLIVGLEQILIVQILIPMKRDLPVFILSAIGASVGILLNLLLVRSMGADGSAIVWLSAESAVCLAALITVFCKTEMSFPVKRVLLMLLLYLPLLPALMWISTLPIEKVYLRLGLSCGLTALYFLIVSCWIIKDELVLGLFRQTFARLKKN